MMRRNAKSVRRSNAQTSDSIEEQRKMTMPSSSTHSSTSTSTASKFMASFKKSTHRSGSSHSNGKQATAQQQKKESNDSGSSSLLSPLEDNYDTEQLLLQLPNVLMPDVGVASGSSANSSVNNSASFSHFGIPQQQSSATSNHRRSSFHSSTSSQQSQQQQQQQQQRRNMVQQQAPPSSQQQQQQQRGGGGGGGGGGGLGGSHHPSSNSSSSHHHYHQQQQHQQLPSQFHSAERRSSSNSFDSFASGSMNSSVDLAPHQYDPPPPNRPSPTNPLQQQHQAPQQPKQPSPQDDLAIEKQLLQRQFMGRLQQIQQQQQEANEKQQLQQQFLGRLQQIAQQPPTSNAVKKATPFQRNMLKTPSTRSFLAEQSAMEQKQTNSTATTTSTVSNSTKTSNSAKLRNELHQKLQPIKESSPKDLSQEEERRAMLAPFISDIVYESVVKKNHHHYHFETSSTTTTPETNTRNSITFRSSLSTNESNNRNGRHTNSSNLVSFRPYTCQAAVLFVDLCGYSKITAAIAHYGAHYISETVNAYLSRLLAIINEYGGDVIKFAGDAIMIIWYGNEMALEANVLCAAICATELQTRAGEHKVGINTDDGSEMSFKIHCGLGCGPLDSEIFEAPVNNNMQRLYHYVGGEALMEIGELVDLAKPGEICISQNCFNFIENGGTYADIDGQLGAKILHSIDIDDPGLFEFVYWHIRDMKVERQNLRKNVNIEEEFIHDNVLAYLRQHSGFAPTQIAQMRNLCVLFIAMTSNGSSVNWLMEVQAILDNKRCPIVQIILDDKGVHVVAAVNLYEAIPEASLVGLEVCQELIKKRVGAAVGCASGLTFCGVTGSSDACRWDITGPAVVRAARLMQFALNTRLHFAIDGSLYENPMAATRMKVLDHSVPMKGTREPIVVYTLSDASSFSAFRILESVHGSVHNNEVQKIQNHIDSRQRSAVIVTGIPLAGMIIACQRAAGYSDFVPYLHLCETSAGYLQLARTIATWFQYVNDLEIKELSQSVISDMALGCWSCAHDQCVQLVNVAIDKGYNACFVVDRIQYLDIFSLSLIRECLHRPRQKRSSFDEFSLDSYHFPDQKGGHICFLCTHLSLYNSKSAEDLVEDILRSNQAYNIPIVSLGESTKEELRIMTREMVDMEVEDRWLDAYSEASGYCAEYFLQRVEAVRKICAVKWRADSKHKQTYFEISNSLALHIPPRFVRKNKQLKVTTICPELAMIFSNIYDDFPPVCQMIIKVITIATRSGLNKLMYGVLFDAMNDLLDHGVVKESFDMLMKEMKNMYIVKVSENDESTIGGNSVPIGGVTECLVSMQSPALADITMDVCTPVQVKSIAQVLIKRIEKTHINTFQRSFTLASLYCLLDEKSQVQRLWNDGYRDFVVASRDWPERQKNQWREIIDDEIRDAGYDTHEILGAKFYVPDLHQPTISPSIAVLKFYSAPIALGPMSQSLAILCRNTFYESGLFTTTKGKSTIYDAVTIRTTANTVSGRYMMQLSVLENYLRDMGFGATSDEVQSEMEMISFIANPSESTEGVATKAALLLEEIVPRFVEHRLQRLYKLVRYLKDNSSVSSLPDVLESANIALRLAYEALQVKKNWMDAAQDALMILATMNWKPKYTVMEYIPIQQQHTVAYIRDATLKRSSHLVDDNRDINNHRQNVDDFEAFIIVSALLENATDHGLC